jgi:hypothetical protein
MSYKLQGKSMAEKTKNVENPVNLLRVQQV